MKNLHSGKVLSRSALALAIGVVTCGTGTTLVAQESLPSVPLRLIVQGTVFQNTGDITITTRPNGDVFVTTANPIAVENGDAVGSPPAVPPPPPPVLPPTPPPPPPPPPGPIVGCADPGALPETITNRGAINWAAVPGIPQDFFTGLPRDNTATYRFCTTPTTPRSGQIAIAAAPAETTVMKRMWISTTPGGEPLAQGSSPTRNPCDRPGTTLVVVNWQHTPVSGTRCMLQDDTQYFLNISAQCPKSQCGYFLNHY